MTYLQLVASVDTSGARAVESFVVKGVRYLAIPQLAVDNPDESGHIDGGDSDTANVLIVRGRGDFPAVDHLPVPGGEDVESFTIDRRQYLAVARIRAGRGPYDYAHRNESTSERQPVSSCVKNSAAMPPNNGAISRSESVTS